MSARSINKRTLLWKFPLGLLLLGLACYPLAHAFGWPTIGAIMLLSLVGAVIVLAWSMRSETIALATSSDVKQEFDERQKLITLKSRALAGRVAVYTGAALGFIMAGLQALSEELGVPRAAMDSDVPYLNAWAGGLLVPCGVYFVARFLATWRYSRKG